MNLESVSQLVAQHSSTPFSPSQNKIDEAANKRAILERMVQRLMWGMFLIGIGIILIVTNKSFDLRLLGFIASFFMLGGAGLAGYGVLGAVRDDARISGARLRPTISEAAEVKSLPTQPVPLSLPSITERTTQLITSDRNENADEDRAQDVSRTSE